MVGAYNNTGYHINGTYRVTITVEDYSQYPVAMETEIFANQRAFSTVPLQFTLRVLQGPCDSKDEPEFVLPTPKNLTRISSSPADLVHRVPVNVSFYVQSPDISATQFMLSAPMRLVYEYLTDDLSHVLNRSDVKRISCIWRPDMRTQTGTQQICAWAVDKYGLTSKVPRCATVIVADNNQCHSVNCYYNGTCVNIYKDPRESCVCLPGYKGHDCSEIVYCLDGPCERNGTCVSHKSGFTCVCPPGYTGTYCETKIANCVTSPCRNNAMCVNYAHGYTCLCPNNFTGINCELKGFSTQADKPDSPMSWIFLILVSDIIVIIIYITSVCVILRGSADKSKPEEDKPEQEDSGWPWLLLLLIASLVVLCAYIATVCIAVNRSGKDGGTQEKLAREKSRSHILQLQQ